ncbi:MAG: hypothetical protein ABI619_13630, partial [Betaproteobacteria bacterium]
MATSQEPNEAADPSLSKSLQVVLILPQIVFGHRGGYVGGYVNSVISLCGELQHACELELVAGFPNWDTQAF